MRRSCTMLSCFTEWVVLIWLHLHSKVVSTRLCLIRVGSPHTGVALKDYSTTGSLYEPGLLLVQGGSFDTSLKEHTREGQVRRHKRLLCAVFHVLDTDVSNVSTHNSLVRSIHRRNVHR